MRPHGVRSAAGGPAQVRESLQEGVQRALGGEAGQLHAETAVATRAEGQLSGRRAQDVVAVGDGEARRVAARGAHETGDVGARGYRPGAGDHGHEGAAQHDVHGGVAAQGLRPGRRYQHGTLPYEPQLGRVVEQVGEERGERQMRGLASGSEKCPGEAHDGLVREVAAVRPCGAEDGQQVAAGTRAAACDMRTQKGVQVPVAVAEMREALAAPLAHARRVLVGQPERGHRRHGRRATGRTPPRDRPPDAPTGDGRARTRRAPQPARRAARARPRSAGWSSARCTACVRSSRWARVRPGGGATSRGSASAARTSP